MADKRVVLTEEGLKKLEEKLEYLKSVRRLEVADRLKAAIALKPHLVYPLYILCYLKYPLLFKQFFGCF